MAPDSADKAAVVAVVDVAAAVVVAVVVRIQAWSVEQVYLPDWWKQNCTARKVYTRSAMAV